MLLAYIDEFGHVGPYISPDHPKFKTHPIFGYSGFIIPAHNVRPLGGFFESTKANLLAYEIEKSGKHPPPAVGEKGRISSHNKKYGGLRS